jgi:hypothetical protein
MRPMSLVRMQLKTLQSLQITIKAAAAISSPAAQLPPPPALAALAYAHPCSSRLGIYRGVWP